MAHPRFGTDGVRGLAIEEISPEFVMALGRAVGRVLAPERMLVGRDTRESGPVLQAAFAAGVAAEGVDVVDLGVLPTPAVAMFAARHHAPGAVITASHNPYSDNGVKVFAAGGSKLSDDHQNQIESALEAVLSAEPSGGLSRKVGSVTRQPEAVDDYVSHVVALLGSTSLEHTRVVLDTANGAMSVAAPDALRRLGAEVIVLNDAPDGININDSCGATAPDRLCEFVAQAEGIDFGFAFDGDGDRVIAVDHRGRTVDGDRLIAMSAIDRQRRGRLAGGVVVTTVMANLGFHRAMHDAGIQVVTTPVGDRFVLDAMSAGGFVLGGEQSGHIVHRDLGPTGDGLVAAIVVADSVRRSGRPLAQLADEVMTAFPQVLRNVPVGRRPADPVAEMADDIAGEEAALGGRGRVLVRASGTEPVVRVMVEAETLAEAEAAAERLVTAAKRRFT